MEAKETPMERTPRIGITLSPYELRMLTLWAKIHGRPRSTYAAQIIGARIEANAETIRRELAEIARVEGCSIDELEARWLGESDED